MYIGRLGDGSTYDDGIYILLKEVVDNAIDEFIMGFGRKVVITVRDNLVTVRDHGRGIPLGKVIDCVSVINTGAKYNDDVFQFSVGLNGIGTKAVNALSSHFKVISYRGGRYSEAEFKRGRLRAKNRGNNSAEPDGTYVEFLPDREIFGHYRFNMEYVEKRMWSSACLNSGLSFILNGRRFASRRGLFDLLYSEVGDEVGYDIIYHKGKYLEFAFTHTTGYGETYFSFVNGQFTTDGGTHQAGFREGILKGVNEFFKKAYSGVDIREGIAGAVAIRLKSPVFESQTKNKLGNTEVRGWVVSEVRSAVVDFLHKNTQIARKLQERILTNERLRKELNTVKKEAKAAARKIAIKIRNLKDCKYHLQDGSKGKDSTIFITEGQSASGSMVSARDVYTQAIFSLRGKPRNVFGKKKAAIYKNEELYNMMMALGIEDDVANLRYARIVIATDADHDGFHIRNLLLTFFLNYFEELVSANRVYILETPLFRVRNRKETRYCYSERERKAALEEIKDPEITRFKGLGEISPREFAQFIGEDMRLIKVNVRYVKNVSETLRFYMGKNTPERRDFIMGNLI
ncbi:MAG: ATP-binding protein [Deltaproteobacteria bacterium]|nr:ATP-binding protein [Deltaproteobacteria bacterium]MBW2049435.1 ATP-binding protein [Deltaproteobacteria bacterium]MBW2112631.1 ATP-binding protein [Deltaproteobacteria bacterium]MBW2354007.1 ATP-binding protein [Deltaproteobacteria bacterium]HDZ89731.1 type IIA DNA topoisomerase subunit B [Deltaproteobacteria bacterium]